MANLVDLSALPGNREPGTLQSGRGEQYLTFTLGEETFAMAIRYIREVIQHESLTVVPLMPAYVRGVINMRGLVVPVIDLGVRFGRPTTEVTKRTCVVILEVEQDGQDTVLGALVDSVTEVLDVAAGDIEPAPAFGSSLRSDFIQGIARITGKFVILLDVNHVLSVEEMATLPD